MPAMAAAFLYFRLKPRPAPGEAGGAVNESVDELTVELEENGQTYVKELDKVVLSRGAWATVLFRYQKYRPETDDFGRDQYVINRYKKIGGEYKKQSKFNISSPDQARKIVEALSGWLSADIGDRQ